MKKCFAIFCAIVLTPMFSAQAWVGGPFSLNTYGETSNIDGVYEATAVSLSTNGAIGLFRFIVGNEYVGVNPTGVVTSLGQQIIATNQQVVTIQAVNSGNVFIGGLGGRSNIWFFQGVGYYGTALGSIAPGSGTVTGFGFANDNFGNGTNTIESFFQGTLDRSTRRLAATSFSGTGTAQESQAQVIFPIGVFGSKVSNNIFVGL